MTLVLLAAMPGISHAQKKVADQTQRQRTYETIAPVVQKEQPKVFWYGGEVNLGGGINLLSSLHPSVAMNLETIHGVFITKYAYIGAGLQIQYSNRIDLVTNQDEFGYYETYEYKTEKIAVPFFLHFRLNVPINTHITSYISCSTNLKSIETDQMFLAAHLGITINNRWNFGLGLDWYVFENERLEHLLGRPWISESLTLPNIKVGYVFGSKGVSSSKK